MDVRKVYDKYPYPTSDMTVLTDRRWVLAPMDWIGALWKPTEKNLAPKRILVAGCGAGREAFTLRRRFPKAKIAAVDFSPRSIAIARHVQKRARAMRNIRFVVADLAHRDLSKLVGPQFDFISCHGVLSYVPQQVRALANLRQLLKPDGALYLGVNGPEHYSVRGRLFLPTFGLDLVEPREGTYLRDVLKLWDAIGAESGTRSLAKLPIGYLAGDFFGPLIRNLPLRDWTQLASKAGLCFQANCSFWGALRLVMEKDQARFLMPRSRAKVCQLLAVASPGSFYRLLFTRRVPGNPPWQNDEKLRLWRPILTKLYKVSLPKRTRSQRALRRVTFKSVAMNTQLDWKMPEWELEILRRSDGKRTLGEILKGISEVVPPQLLQTQLYVLHQLLVITLMPS